MLECWARSFHNFLIVGLSEAFEGTQTEVEECRSWHAVVAEITTSGEDIREYPVMTGFQLDSLRGSIPRPEWVEKETARDQKILGGSHLSTRRDKRHQ